MGKTKLGKFKILKNNLKFSSKIIDVYTQNIETPDGNIVEWVHVDHKGAAAILPIDAEGKILLIKQYRNNPDEYVYEIPAGGLNLNEKPIDCAIRELEEETGYKCKNITELFSVYSSIGICNEKIHYYIATDLYSGNTNLDDDEYIEVYRFTIDEILSMIKNKEIVDAKVVTAVMSYIVLNNK